MSYNFDLPQLYFYRRNLTETELDDKKKIQSYEEFEKSCLQVGEYEPSKAIQPGNIRARYDDYVLSKNAPFPSVTIEKFAASSKQQIVDTLSELRSKYVDVSLVGFCEEGLIELGESK